MQESSDQHRRAYYAHSREGKGPDTWERLEWHLRRAGVLSRRFGRRFDAGNTAAASGLLHDVGKYSDAFQRRIAGDAGSVDHATGGAKEAVAHYGHEVGRLLAYGIAGHHGGLPNGGKADDRALLSRLESTQIPRGHDRWKGRIGLPDPARVEAEIQAFLKRGGEKLTRFSVGFLARMVFSCLVDADFLATEWFYDRGKAHARKRFPNPAALAPILRAHLDVAFPGRLGEINRQRAAILNACRNAAARDTGVFSLDVPTGGGKTLSSLSFALEHAARHGLDRVIYAIPYISIIDQTADEFRKALGAAGPDIVLEHHSAVDVPVRAGEPDEPIGPRRLRLATESWDVPVIVTTTVQFFDSLYSNRPSRCRKLHSLARAVIVLDEVQALPLDRLSPCLAALRELTTRYGSSLVLCSATMPNFATHPALKVSLPPASPIITQSPALLAAFRRVAPERIPEPIDDETLAAQLAGSAQALCIVDARRHATELFALLPDDGGRFHLSAAMCPAHRRSVLQTVKDRLSAGLPCRLVATRVIEAGVDISFPVVWRAMAGVDSLAQAAGRCNRHGEGPGVGRFVVFEPAREDAIPKPLADLRRRAGEAKEVLRQHQDPLSQKAVANFFERIIALGDHDWDGCWKRLNDAPLDRIPFREIAEDFRMIDDATQPLIVRWKDEASALIERLRWALGPNAPQPRRLPLDVLRSSDEVRKCTAVGCPSWPFRIGANPWRAPLSEAERARRRERIAGVVKRSRNSPLPEKPRGVDAASPSAPISAPATEASEP
jgi:CRISPR-associated endonuclease/helicase Cas3